MNCNYPNCFECNLPDCKIEYPQKARLYKLNNGKEYQREYRMKRRKKLGIKTEQELMIEKQDKIYNFFVDFFTEHLYPPSVSDIQKEFSIKANSDVYRDLGRLVDRGLLKKDETKRRYSLVGYKLVKE